MGAYLSEAKLKGAQLANAVLGLCDLSLANFDDASLWRANLSESLINSASFCGANLEGANFHDSDLREAKFYAAKLNFANFGSADLNGADFTNAKIGWTTFGSNDLSLVKGLVSIEHVGPSVIGIDTIYKSKGRIPATFLRRAGVPESFTNLISSFANRETKFHSCFISFTEADDEFAELLYNDLLKHGIRCWRWKEDAKWGETLMKSIDEAVRGYDKLIVICSEQSLNSHAVIREIERALQKDDEALQRGEEVLFPIRLDDYILSGWNHHRRADVVAKHVGDFRQWKEPPLYLKALERLVRDLRAERAS